jgi:hypothetical protein
MNANRDDARGGYTGSSAPVRHGALDRQKQPVVKPQPKATKADDMSTLSSLIHERITRAGLSPAEEALALEKSEIALAFYKKWSTRATRQRHSR